MRPKAVMDVTAATDLFAYKTITPCRQTVGAGNWRAATSHRPLAWSVVPPPGPNAAAAACSLVLRNSLPSTHIRCMITANRRAGATIALFIPRCLAICIAQALSHDHFLERSCCSGCALVGLPPR
jgi:hypothetical protein